MMKAGSGPPPGADGASTSKRLKACFSPARAACRRSRSSSAAGFGLRPSISLFSSSKPAAK